MPEVLIFSDFVQNDRADMLRRSAGPYKVASALRQQGISTQVISMFCNLTLAGLRQVSRRFCGQETVLVAFSTTFLNQVSQSYMDRIRQSSDLYLIDPEKSDGWIVDRSPEFSDREYFFCYTEDLWDEIFAIFKSINPRIKFLFGGTKIKMNFRDDVITNIGVGEEVVPEIVEILKKGNAPQKTYFGRNDLYNSSGFKTSSILWDRSDLIAPNEWLFLETSRGCAFRCAYCAYEHKGRLDFNRDPDSLRDEMIRNYELFGTTGYWFTDDLYNDSEEKITLYHDRVFSQLPFRIEWKGYLRLDLLWKKPRMAEILLEDGLRACSFGIETMHDRAGKAVGKGLGRERIIKTLEMLKEIWGDEVVKFANWIVGLPYEPPESIRATHDWVQDHPDLLDANVFQALWLSETSTKELYENIASSNTKYKRPGLNHMGVEPFRFGYKVKESLGPREWDNGLMTSKQAADMVAEFKQARKKIVPFWNYGSLRRVGYDHVQARAFIVDETLQDRHAEFYGRATAGLQEYFSTLLDPTDSALLG